MDRWLAADPTNPAWHYIHSIDKNYKYICKYKYIYIYIYIHIYIYVHRSYIILPKNPRASVYHVTQTEAYVVVSRSRRGLKIVTRLGGTSDWEFCKGFSITLDWGVFVNNF